MSSNSILLVRPLINTERNAPFFLPLGLVCCASPWRDAGFPVEILDYEYLVRRGEMEVPDNDRWIADLCDPIVDKSPVIVGLTALADTLPACLLMGRYIKQAAPHIIVVIGGPGVFGTMNEIGARFADCLDYLCVNEGEVAMVELARRVAANDRGCAERAMRLVFAAALVPAIFLLPRDLWFINWIMAAFLTLAGLVNFCPTVVSLRYIGFR